jgi:CelD/BcsL family acetyltransferase involved in cellulose biosynthesis
MSHSASDARAAHHLDVESGVAFQWKHALTDVDLAEWNLLLSQHPEPTPFQTRAFLIHWREHFAHADSIRVLTAKVGQCVVGLLPVYIRTIDPGLQQIEIIGTSPIPSANDGLVDRTDLIIDGGRWDIGEQLVRRLLEAISPRTTILFRYVPESGPLASITPRTCRILQRRAFWRIASRSLYTKLPSTWEEFTASKSAKWRKRLKDRLNLLSRSGTVHAEIYTGPSYHQSLLDDVFTVDSRSWKAEQGTSHLPKGPRRDFIHNLFDDLCRTRQASIALLRINGRPVAYELNLTQQNRVYAYLKAYDKEFKQVGPGTFLTHFVMRDAITRGAAEYDQLRGDEPYKRIFTERERRDLDILISPQARWAAVWSWWRNIGEENVRRSARKILVKGGFKAPIQRFTSDWMPV